jgi:hypothetical protein
MFIRNFKFFLFGDYKHIEAQPEKINNISNKLVQNGIGLIPGTFQQINPSFGLKAFERIMFTNSKEKLSVQISMEAIEINKVVFDNKWYNLKSETDEFISRVKKIIRSLAESNEGLDSGRRVSLIVEVLYDKEQIKPFNDIYNDFNNTLPDYDSSETFEWNTRAAKRKNLKILGYEEEVNIVTQVLRTNGQVNSFNEIQQFDTVQSIIDINTLDNNNRPRVNQEFVNEFLEKVNDLYSSLNSKLEVRILESK